MLVMYMPMNFTFPWSIGSPGLALNDPAGGGTGMMSREAAANEINSLKKDTAFAQRLLAGGREERRKWDDLHKVAFPPQVA
jgi:hypothetical protein